MKVEGGCFCGAIRYEAEGDPVMKAQCHCRQCQYFAGGAPNLFVGMPKAGFAYTKGTPKSYARPDAPVFPVTRNFCAECGVQVTAASEQLPDVVFLKVGTFDRPADFGGPDMAIFTKNKQPFHLIAEGVETYDTMPPL